MITRLIPILALLSLFGLAACQEDGAEGDNTEAETGATEESTEPQSGD